MIQMTRIDEIHPYENNPRENEEAVPKVAASIQQFGFLSPIIVDSAGVILAGHTRYEAAKSLGLTEVPVVYATNLTPEQAKAFRLADNKTAEFSRWDNFLLGNELEELAAFDFDMADFGFDMSDSWRRRQAWKRVEKFCNLRQKIKTHSHMDFFATSFFETNTKGKGTEITKIKENPDNAPLFADCLVDYVIKALGNNLAAGDWCMMTAPRRRHKTGFHFATEICRKAAADLAIPFYVDAVTAKDRNRLEPEFFLAKDPREKNVLVFDDLVTTGQTARAMRRLLLEAGHVVLILVGIKN